MVKMVDATPDRNQQKLLDKKLEKCRNPENNPDSEIYKKRMQALLDEDDDLYHTISSTSDSLNTSALNMSVCASPEVT
jgi:cyclin H